jgi:hypothetical protein
VAESPSPRMMNPAIRSEIDIARKLELDPPLED